MLSNWPIKKEQISSAVLGDHTDGLSGIIESTSSDGEPTGAMDGSGSSFPDLRYFR